MKKPLKVLVALLVLEVLLTCLFFYLQPVCEPCLPGVHCPPCISDEQIYIRWAGFGIALVTFGYLTLTKKLSQG